MFFIPIVFIEFFSVPFLCYEKFNIFSIISSFVFVNNFSTDTSTKAFKLLLSNSIYGNKKHLVWKIAKQPTKTRREHNTAEKWSNRIEKTNNIKVSHQYKFHMGSFVMPLWTFLSIWSLIFAPHIFMTMYLLFWAY